MEAPNWREFFFNELKTLKARTGFLQWEKYELSQDGINEARELVGFMILEVQRPPFDKIKAEVLQRVISRAVIEVKDFTGLNAKFIRQALNDWWNVNGDRVLMAENRKENSVYEKVQLSKEDNEKVDYMLRSYRARLLQEAGPIKEVKKMEPKEIEKEGAEWRSELERKAIKYVNPHPPEWYEKKDKIHRAASVFYKDTQDFSKFSVFPVEDHQVFAASESDAQEIYKLAK